MYCVLKRVIEGKIEGRIAVMGKQGRRCKQLLDDFKEMRGCWELKRKYCIALCEALAVEESMDLS
jgi:hypothetical protein